MGGVAARLPWSDLSPGLLGRDRELGELQRVLGGSPRSAVVLGEPGEGKTSLLSAVGDYVRRERWVVLTAAGRISDRALPFSGLSELLVNARSLGGRSARERHERLLRHVRGENEPASATPLGLRLDVLAWLEDLAGRHQLLVAIDDAQWLDPTSLQILAFLAHRVADSPVALLFAARSSQPPAELAELPAVPLRPLPAEDAGRVLLDAWPDLPTASVLPIVRRAAGNPLALIEFARTHVEADLEAVGEADVPARVEHAFAGDLVDLEDTTRAVLLLAAAGGEDLTVLAEASHDAHVVDALEPAERAGLVRVRGSEVRFRHPLAREAVYASATAAQRAAAHRALADAYPSGTDRRTWHRAESVVARDEAVAGELAAAARHAVDRVAYPEAARALRRAVALTPDPQTRERRLVELLHIGVPLGQTAAQIDTARLIRDQTTDPQVRASAQQFIGLALTQTMDQEAARIALEDSISQSVGIDPSGTWGSLTTLAVLVYQTAGDPRVLDDWVRQIGRNSDEGPLDTAARMWVRAASQPSARPPDLLREVQHAGPLPQEAPAVVIGWRAMMLGAAAWLLDLPELAAAHLREARAILGRGDPQELLPTLVGLAQVCADRVALDDAEEAARILYDIADAQGLEYQRAVAQHTQAAVAALRGDRQRARRLAEDALTNLDLASCVALEIGLRMALSDSWYGEDDRPRWEQLRATFDAAGRPRHGRLSIRALVPAVATALRCNLAEEAELLLVSTVAALPHALGAYQAMAVTTAQALLADDSTTDALFRRVVDDPAHAQWAFELANARLEYGRRLRRMRRFPEARNQLVPALRVFQRLQTLPWAEAARHELQRTGGTTPSTDTTTWSLLTAQEREVIRLAASGLTNREIGEAMFLSPRTVGVHLYRAFPKLGVTARGQLKALATRLEQ